MLGSILRTVTVRNTTALSQWQTVCHIPKNFVPSVNCRTNSRRIGCRKLRTQHSPLSNTVVGSCLWRKGVVNLRSDMGGAEGSSGGTGGAVTRSSHKHTNRLAKEQSPYLLQHAHNPVGTVVEHMTAGEAEEAQLKPSESGESEEQKVAKTAENSLSGKQSGGQAAFVICIASKGSAEADCVERLKSGDGLQLPDGAVVITAAESTCESVGELFDVFEYLEYLQTSQFGRLVLYSSLIPSTQTLLSQNFHSFPPGTVCIAGAQLQGKGRGGNVWQSPKGCLMFSFTTQMTDGRMVPFLQYIVSLAVITGVEETCKLIGTPVPDVRIKWPNDLYANGLKIGGVLCTSTYRAKTFNIVVGVGLNVGNREPTTCLDALIEELLGGPAAIKQGQLLAAIMSEFEVLNKTFQDQGFLPLQEEYCRRWLHSGQSVVLEEREAGSSSISHVPVTIQGLTPMGYLLASDDKGEQYELHPDGNSFDFMKGLVRQKLAV